MHYGILLLVVVGASTYTLSQSSNFLTFINHCSGCLGKDIGARQSLRELNPLSLILLHIRLRLRSPHVLPRIQIEVLGKLLD